VERDPRRSETAAAPNLYRPRPVGRHSITGLCLLAAALAIAVAVAGCGGGGSSSSAGGETTSAAGEASGGSESSSGKSESSGGSGSSGGASGESGSSGGKAAPGGEISDAGFVKRANTICEEGKKQSLEEMSAYVKKHKGEGGSGQQAIGKLRQAIQAVIVPAIQTQAEEIRALKAPKADEAKVDAFLAALEEGVETAEQASGSSTAPFAQSFKRSAELAREYGLDGCAYG
jgi:hypothetical protein